MLTNNPMVFFGVIALLAAAIHFYLWFRLVRSTTRPGRWRRTGTFVIVGLAVVGAIGFMVTRTVGVDAWLLAWLSYGWIALMFYLLLGLIVLELPRAVYSLRQRRKARVVDVEPTAAPTTARTSSTTVSASTPHGGTVTTRPIEHTRTSEEDGGADRPDRVSTPAGVDRRTFLARAYAATACVAAGGMVGWGMLSAFGDLRTTRVTVPLPGIDPRLSGFRIALVSDTHFGPFLDVDLAERVVTAVNRERPDLVAIVGDLADGTVAEIGAAAEPLRHLKSRHGTYFATGNHDYSSGVDEWLELARELGMRPLLNEHVEIAAGSSAFDLAGVNDVMAPMYDREGPDFDAALADRDTSRPVLLLAHQPVQVHSAIEHGVTLQLSGHTHGGQTAPFDRLVGLQQPVVAGLARKESTSIFVTRGAGFFGPPVRAGIPPEVAIVTLDARS